MISSTKHMCVCVSLLSSSTTLSSSNSVESFLDILTCSRGIALLALQVKQTRACISADLCLDALATQTAHILLHILLVKTVDSGALVTTLQQHVVF